MLYTLPPESIEDYKRDGVIVLRKVLSPNEVEEIRQGINYNIKNPSPLAKIASPDSDTGRFFEDFCNWTRISEYRKCALNPKLGYIASALMQSKITRLYHDHTLVKEPKTQQPTPWHQDQPYYNIKGFQNVSFWIPVDNVSINSAMEFVSGTHLGPWLMPRTFKDNEAKWFPEGSLVELPDIEKLRAQLNILSWEMEAGDALCFNMLTLHAAKGSTDLRRAFSLRYIGDNILHAPRPWVTSPPFTGLEKELPAGVPMNHPLFPIVYSSCCSHI